MKSPAPRNSKIFSSLYEDVEVLEMPPPLYTNRASKPSSSKQKKVICHEIIDLDIEEVREDVLHIDGSSKGKRKTSSKWSDNGPSRKRSSTSSSKEFFVDERLRLFKRFDTVENHSDHHFARQTSSARSAPKNWAKKIQEEWKILEKDLPDTISVRVYESRMDLLRAVIVGAEGTPYHDGLYFFDVFFPRDYPSVPPKVHYHSGGLRINPNLYECGKVCLSLLNTWDGRGQEKWLPNKSTMLQVLVSIQGLILNAKPFYNEPGYEGMFGRTIGEMRACAYNEKTFMYTLQTMVYTMRRPPKHFEAYVMGHFCSVAREVLVSCKAYLDGAQVGCLVKGGVQDVDEGDKSCSTGFKIKLVGFIATLVNQFSSIGAKDCQEFLSLSQYKIAPPPPSATATATATGNLNFLTGLISNPLGFFG